MRELNLAPGHSARFFETLDSTNEQALRLVRAGAGVDGLWIVADTQTKGRGRMGRKWISDKGNLFTSHLCKPKIPASRAAELSFVAALAVFHALTDTLKAKGALSFKWPNDVLLDGQKVAGILVETETGAENWVVVGMGINIISGPEKVRYPATYLEAVSGKKINKNNLLERLSKAWAGTLLSLYQDGGFEMIRNLWLMSAEGLGHLARVSVGNEEIKGVFEDLGPKGELLLRLPDGEKRVIISGEILELNA